MQELRPTGIALANENEAESVLSINMYLVCGAGGPACGYETGPNSNSGCN